MLTIQNLSKTFRGFRGLNNVDLRVNQGEMVALIGASGSGKSTLLRHVAGLLNGDRGIGSIRVAGQVLQQNGRTSRNVREQRQRIGMIFQQFNLVGRLSVHSNVLMGALGRTPAWRTALGLFSETDRRLAMESLDRVGIADKAWQRASTLSGGQQQRAAIARALTQKAELVLADEPIASLDPESARRVMDILADINRNDGITVVVSLHQVDFAVRYCPRTVALHKGVVMYDGPSSALTPDLLRRIYGAQSAELFAPQPQTPYPSEAAPSPALNFSAACSA